MLMNGKLSYQLSNIDGDVGNNDEEDAGENKTHLPVAENIL